VCFRFIAISHIELYILFILDIWITCLFTYELYAWVLTECQRFLQFLTSSEEESSVPSKGCIVYFIYSDDGNSSKSCQ
jgi:hypothetical protein